MIEVTSRRLSQRPRRWPCRRSSARSRWTEISFYFPVAVGGPITKIIDGYAADFQRENPDQGDADLCRHLSGHADQGANRVEGVAGPQMAVLLSTDVFSLIDDDLILPFDTLAEE